MAGGAQLEYIRHDHHDKTWEKVLGRSWEEKTVPNHKISIALGIRFNLDSKTPLPVSVICISREQRIAVKATSIVPIGINGN